MPSFDELDFKLRAFMKLYRYRRYDTTPHTPAATTNRSRVLVTTPVKQRLKSV